MKRPLFWIRIACIFLFIFTGLFSAQEGMAGKPHSVGEGIALPPDSAPASQVPAHPITLYAAGLPCAGTPEPGTQLLILQQDVNGYTGAEDTTLAPYEGNLSDKWFVRVGYKGQDSALIRFDVASIPPGSHILCAALSLYAEMWSGSPFELDIGAYAVKRDWVAQEATWYQASAHVPWQIGGCNGPDDRSQTPESVVTIQNIRTWYHFDLTQVVDGWVNSALPNYGISLQPVDRIDVDHIWFAASDDVAPDGSIANRPKLIILYVPPPTPTPTATATASATPTSTPSETMLPTETATPIVPPTATATPTVPAVPTQTATPTPTVPVVPTETATPTTPTMPTETATPTAPVAPTETATPGMPTVPTQTATPTPSATPITPVLPTVTATPTQPPIPVTPTAIPTVSLYQLFAPVIWRNYPMRCVAWGYSFNEEFNDPALTNWSGNLNGGHQEVSDGVLHQWAPASVDRFPLLWNNSLFANAGDNFAFEVRFRYSDFAAYG
ncbi:MAG: DNRLRE domain-containing protein, partial [Anaerolineae bacterium]